MEAEKQLKEPISRKSHPKSGGGNMSFVDNRPQNIYQTKMLTSIQSQSNSYLKKGGEDNNSLIQRKIIINGDEEYINKVRSNIDILLSQDWRGINIKASENNLTLDLDDKYLHQAFIDLAGDNKSATLLRRRIASIGKDPFGGNNDMIIEKTEDSSAFDFGSDSMAVLWNSEEKMICYTENGFQLCPPEILLAHEIGHADGFYTQPIDGISEEYDRVNKLSAPYEEVRNVGLFDDDSNPYSENMIRSQRGYPKRLVYNKLVNWWVKEGKVYLELCGDDEVLRFYRNKDEFRAQSILNLIYEASPELQGMGLGGELVSFILFGKTGTSKVLDFST